MRGARGARGLRSLAVRLLQSGRLTELWSGSSGVASLVDNNLNAARASSLYSRVSETCAVSSRMHFASNSCAHQPSLRFLGSSLEFFRPARSNGFSTSAAANPEPNAEKITVTFVNKDGEEKEIKVPVGMSMLEAAHENDIELEGACEGSLACSTCHVIITDEELYNKLPEPSDEENDMLDLAFGLTETSRLGCQVIAKPELDGLRLALPAATRNFAVDGHVPKPH